MRKKLLVAKFGGESLVSSRVRNIAANHCKSLLDKTEKLIVVVSAMGRKGDPYATDTLIDLISSKSSDMEKDRLMICGEVISALVMATVLRGMGIRAVALTGWEAGICTDGVPGNARIVSVDTTRIEESLKKQRVVVIAGFQGVAPLGYLNTLGRGGTDTSAVVLGVALEADEILLYKTVDSVYTADPDKVPNALKIERISTEDLRQMAWHGAKIVHPRASEIAGDADIKIAVMSHNTGEKVTEIEPFMLRSGKYITGVASGPDAAQFRVRSDNSSSMHEFYSRAFGLVAEAGVSMDMFSVFDSSAMFTVPLEDKEKVIEVLNFNNIDHETISPCAKVSIVGAGMHGIKGVMARFSSALDKAGIDMLQTVDSHATISALVLLRQRDEALRVLHREFIEQ